MGTGLKITDLVSGRKLTALIESIKQKSEELEEKERELHRLQKKQIKAVEQYTTQKNAILDEIQRSKNKQPAPKDINLNVACPSTGIVRSRCKCRRCEVARI